MYNTLTSNTSALVGATGGNRLSRYYYYNDKNMKKFNTSDKVIIGVASVAPAALSYMLKQSLQASALSYGVTSFAIAISLSHFLHKDDVDKANTQFPNKDKDIKETQTMVDKIFDTANPYSLPSGYRVINNSEKAATLRQKEFTKQIAENLYPIFSSTSEDTKKSQAIANKHKTDIATMQKTYKTAREILNGIGDASKYNYGFKYPNSGFYVRFNVLASQDDFNQKKFTIIKNTIKDLDTIQTRPDKIECLLDKPIKKMASDLENHIEKWYKSKLAYEIFHTLNYCSTEGFFLSQKSHEFHDNIKRFNIDELNDLIKFCHTEALWHDEMLESHIKPRHARFEKYYVIDKVNLPDDKKAEVNNRIPFMSESTINSERDSLEKAKKLFRQALREKLLPDEPSPFTASRIREKLIEENKQSDKSFPDFTDTEKPLVALDYDIIKGFGSKEKAIEVRDDILTIEQQQDFFPNKQLASWGLGYEFTREPTEKEFATKRDKKIVKKYATKYHPDKTKDDGKTMAFITGLKAVDLNLAKKYWELTAEQRA
jgi:hypothetical protein